MRSEAATNVRVVALALAAAAILAGCAAGTHTLDDALPVPLRVSTTATTVDLDAPGWFAAESAVYLCATAPPPLPDANAARHGWTPGGDCHDYGRHPSKDGLAVSLPIADLQGSNWLAFQSAAEWYVLVVAVDGDLATSVVRSRFRAPATAVAS